MGCTSGGSWLDSFLPVVRFDTYGYWFSVSSIEILLPFAIVFMGVGLKRLERVYYAISAAFFDVLLISLMILGIVTSKFSFDGDFIRFCEGLRVCGCFIVTLEWYLFRTMWGNCWFELCERVSAPWLDPPEYPPPTPPMYLPPLWNTLVLPPPRQGAIKGLLDFGGCYA